MEITLCGSIDFSEKISEIADKLEAKGHKINIPLYTQKIMNGDLTLDEFKRVKEERGDLEYREAAGEDLIKRHYRWIKESDSILVVNIEKKGIAGYIGGNTFLELGFAYVLEKKIFLLNDIPDMHYKDEIMAMEPCIINADLTKVE